MFISTQQNAGQNLNTRITITICVNMAKLKYLATVAEIKIFMMKLKLNLN
jgi:hypothetical protein